MENSYNKEFKESLAINAYKSETIKEVDGSTTAEKRSQNKRELEVYHVGERFIIGITEEDFLKYIKKETTNKISYILGEKRIIAVSQGQVNDICKEYNLDAVLIRVKSGEAQLEDDGYLISAKSGGAQLDDDDDGYSYR